MHVVPEALWLRALASAVIAVVAAVLVNLVTSGSHSGVSVLVFAALLAAAVVVQAGLEVIKRRAPRVRRPLPILNPEFVGRGDELREMASAAPGRGQRSLDVCVIVGVGGMGKTQLA